VDERRERSCTHTRARARAHARRWLLQDTSKAHEPGGRDPSARPRAIGKHATPPPSPARPATRPREARAVVAVFQPLSRIQEAGVMRVGVSTDCSARGRAGGDAQRATTTRQRTRRRTRRATLSRSPCHRSRRQKTEDRRRDRKSRFARRALGGTNREAPLAARRSATELQRTD
jgi:hypothetical protein